MLIDAAVVAGLVVIAVLPPAAMFASASAGMPAGDATDELPPIQRGPTGKVRDLPVVAPIEEAVLADLDRFRSRLVAAAGEVLGPATDPILALLGPAAPRFGPARGSDTNAPDPYPYRFVEVDALVDPILGREAPVTLATKVADLGAMLILASARHSVTYPNAAKVAYSLLDRARAAGCDAALNLELLVAADTFQLPAQDDVVAAEAATTIAACPGDPTPRWILGQFQSVRGIAAEPGTERSERALAVFRELQRSLPGSIAGWAGEADAQVRLAYADDATAPFTARARFRRALTLYRRAQALEKDAGLAFGEARALLGLARHDEAAALLRRTIGSGPRTPAFQSRLVESLERGHRWAEAAEDGRLGVALAPPAPGIRFAPYPAVVVPSDRMGRVNVEDAYGPVSLGTDRWSRLSVTVGSPPLLFRIADVTDLSFFPDFHPVGGITGIERDCPEWSRRRDLLLAGNAREALVGFPSHFPDRGFCGFTRSGSSESSWAMILRRVAELEGGVVQSVPAGDADTAYGAWTELWRFAGDLDRAEAVAERWVTGAPSRLAYVRKGEVAFLRQQYASAAIALDQAAVAARTPLERAEDRLKQGTAAAMAGQFNAGTTALREADEIASQEFDRLSRFDQAAQARRCQSEDSPCDWAVYISYNARIQQADATRRDKQYREATHLYASARERVVQLVPEAARPAALDNNECLVLVLLGDHDAALQAADRALAVDPANPIFLLNKGYAQEKVGDLDAAADTYGQALRADPTLFPVANNLARIRAIQGRLSDATALLRRAIGANPDHPLAWFNLGVVLDRRGPRHVLEAQGSLARAVRLDPDFRGRARTLIRDDEVAQTTLDLSKPLPPDWGFVTAQRRASVVVPAVVLVLIILRVVAYWAREEAAGRIGAAFLSLTTRGRLRRFSQLGGPYGPALASVATLVLLMLPLIRSAGATVTEVLLLSAGILVILAAFLRVRMGRAGGANAPPKQSTWLPTLAFGVLSGVVNVPYAPLPVTEVVASARARARALAFLGLVTLVLLVVGRISALPATQALGAAALVMIASALTPVKPCDGGYMHGLLVGAASLGTLILGVFVSLGVL